MSAPARANVSALGDEDEDLDALWNSERLVDCKTILHVTCIFLEFNSAVYRSFNAAGPPRRVALPIPVADSSSESSDEER